MGTVSKQAPVSCFSTGNAVIRLYGVPASGFSGFGEQETARRASKRSEKSVFFMSFRIEVVVFSL